jgi:hypothetical protein
MPKDDIKAITIESVIEKRDDLRIRSILLCEELSDFCDEVRAILKRNDTDAQDRLLFHLAGEVESGCGIIRHSMNLIGVELLCKMDSRP